MKKKEKIIQEFKNHKIKFRDKLTKYISSKKENGEIFPPYIPLIGTKYDDYKVLIYGTAQNIDNGTLRNLYEKNFNKLTERLYYFDNFNKKYPTDKMSFTDIDIAPYQTGVLPALLGIYLYAKHNITIYDLNEIHNYIAVSNYYKFSLNNGQSDINPETEINDFIKDYKEIENYYTINDELVEKEIETLKPDIIISFKGRKLDKLKELVKT